MIPSPRPKHPRTSIRKRQDQLKSTSRQAKRPRLDDKNALCSQCKQCDLATPWNQADKFFGANWDIVLGLREWSNPREKFHGLLIWDLGTRLAKSQISCALCRFLWNLRLYDSSRNQYDLRAFPLHWALPFIESKAAYFPPKLRLAQPAVLCVVPREEESPASHKQFTQSRCIFRRSSSEDDGIQARKIAPAADTKQAKVWIEFCVRNHKAGCHQTQPFQSRPNTRSLPGFRLIDCSTGDVIQSSLRRKYAALSYVWGEPGRDLSKYPKVVEDAIDTTKSLGLKYLWVDRYCVDQDNSEEKHQQIASMNTIYEHAELTIIAAAGTDASHGLEGVSRRRKTPPHLSFGQIDLITVPSDAHESIKKSSWWSRGWTYQEGVLSKRRLCFAEQQMYFECASMAAYECFQIPPETLHISSLSHQKRFFRAGLFSGARQSQTSLSKMGSADDSSSRNQNVLFHAENYAHRTLTFNADVLDAFRGILTANGVRSLSGLVVPLDFPLAPFPGWVAGQYFGSGYDRDSHNLAAILVSWWHKPGSNPERVKEFSSWSWAGWRGQIQTQNVQCNTPLKLCGHFASGSGSQPTGPLLYVLVEGSQPTMTSIQMLKRAGKSDISSIVSPNILMMKRQCFNGTKLDFILQDGMIDGSYGRLTIRFRNSPGRSIELATALSVGIDSETFMKNVTEMRWHIVCASRTSELVYFLILRNALEPGPTRRMERVGLCWINLVILRDFAMSNTAIFSQYDSGVLIV